MFSSTDPQQEENNRSTGNDTSSIDAELDALVAEMKAKAKSDIDAEMEAELNSKPASTASNNERFLSSLYSSVDFEASATNSKNSSKTTDRKQTIEKQIDPNQREFINYINALSRASIKNATGFTLNPNEEQSSSDDSTSWKILETIRPLASPQEVPPPLIESSPEGLSSLYSSVSYPLPIPIMMQIPVSYEGGKEPKAGCMKMVDTCKDMSKTKYSNDATSGMMPSSSNNCQNSSNMDKKQMMDMMSKMEEMMNTTMKNYMDKMMTSKVEKAMKMAMGKMKGSQMTPTPKMKPSYMTNMMMNMMDMDKPYKGKPPKCPPCPKMDDREDKPEGKDYKEGKENKESRDSYSSDEKYDSSDDDADDAYAMDSMKEAMKELVMDVMKDTMSQMVSSMPYA